MCNVYCVIKVILLNLLQLENMASIEDFIVKFHNLEGLTVKEKKRSLHSLLLSFKNASTGTLDSISHKLVPTTYLEETFRIDVLIYFKRTDDLLSILVTGNEIGACKVVRQGWFVTELMEKYTPVQFVETLFPKLSLSIRTKILKTILVYVKNEKKIQEIFEILCQYYGWKVASVLLTGCSDDKIREVLKKHVGWLSVSKLKLLFDKNQSLITFYFDLLKNEGECVDNYKWRPLFDYMAKKDPIFFLELSKKFDIYERSFGRQTTKKFVEAKKVEIFDKPSKYIRYLRKDALVRKLGNDFPSFFKKALPKDISGLRYCEARDLLKYYIKNKQYDLYFNSFQELYNKSLWDNVEYMDEQLIEFIPDKEEREKWIKKFDNRVNYEKYQLRQCAMRCSAKMEFLDEDMELCGENAIAERKTAFNTLISTCKLNQDYDAFLNILISFCQRHRNSDVTVLYNFLRTVYKELDMKKLTKDHWKYIKEIITIQLFKKQQLFYPIFIEYIKFLYGEQQPIEELVLSLLKELPQNLDFEYKDEEFEKMILQLYIKLYPQVDDKKNNLAVQITLSVMKWNDKHPTNTIFVHDENIVKTFTKLKDTENLKPQPFKAFKYLICRQKESEQSSDLDEIYWSNFKILNNKTITKWFLKYKPVVLKNHLDQIGIILKDKNNILVHNLKKYDHIGVPEAITKLCLEELETAEPSKRERVIKILILFMPINELVIYLKEHIPKVVKVDIEGADEDTRKAYEIQCALAKHLKSTINLKEALPHLLKYCQGDVLGSALPSLYSSFCRIPEHDLPFALEELSTRATSVRKHAIFLSSLILPIDKVVLKYKQIQKSEKHISVKQHMFLSCYKYFLQNHVPECWLILKEYLLDLKKEQKDILKLIANVHKFPKDHRSIFTECVWELLAKLKKPEVIIDENMDTLLNNLIKSDVITMRKEFCMNVIESKLFDLEKCSMTDSVFGLTKNFLLYGGNTEEKVNFVFQVLRNYKEKFWNDNEKKIDVLKVLHEFCFDIFKDILRKDAEKFDKNFPKLFAEAWKREFTVDETFEEHLFIDFVVIKFESGSNSESISKEMNKSFSSAIEKYGILIINNFKNFLSSSLRLVLKNEDYDFEVLKFLDSFLEENSSPEHCALVVDLLPYRYLNEEAEAVYKKLLNKLLQKEQIVRIRLYGKLKDLGY